MCSAEESHFFIRHRHDAFIYGDGLVSRRPAMMSSTAVRNQRGTGEIARRLGVLSLGFCFERLEGSPDPPHKSSRPPQPVHKQRCIGDIPRFIQPSNPH